MDVVTNLTELRHHDDADVCVLVDSEPDLAVEAASQLDLQWPLANHQVRRPSVIINEGEVDVVLMVLCEDRSFMPLRLLSRGRGVLAIGDKESFEFIRPALKTSRGGNWEALVAATLAIAHAGDEILGAIDDDCQELAEEASGYASSVERRAIGRMRADLFKIGEAQAAHQSMVEAISEAAVIDDEKQQRLLARASRSFEAGQSTTTRLYAMLGDVLNEQDTLVSERLTLVATIFLPLTLATGFFGMNFDWMTDRIGGFGAFMILGIALPTALAGGTLLLVRRLTRSK